MSWVLLNMLSIYHGAQSLVWTAVRHNIGQIQLCLTYPQLCD